MLAVLIADKVACPLPRVSARVDDSGLLGVGHQGRDDVLRRASTGQGAALRVQRLFETRVESAWLQRLRLKSNELPSSFTFTLNLRPYTKDAAAAPAAAQ